MQSVCDSKFWKLYKSENNLNGFILIFYLFLINIFFEKNTNDFCNIFVDILYFIVLTFREFIILVFKMMKSSASNTDNRIWLRYENVRNVGSKHFLFITRDRIFRLENVCFRYQK